MASVVRAARDFARRITENFSYTTVAAQPEDRLKAPVIELLRAVSAAFGMNVAPRTKA